MKPVQTNLSLEKKETFLSLCVGNYVTVMHTHFWCTDNIHSIILHSLSQSLQNMHLHFAFFIFVFYINLLDTIQIIC